MVHAYVVDVFCVFRNGRILEENFIPKRDRHVAEEQERQAGATLDNGLEHLQRFFIAVVITAGAEIWGIEEQKDVLVADEVTWADDDVVRSEGSIKARKENRCPESVRKPGAAGIDADRNDGNAVVHFAREAAQLIRFKRIEIKPARNGLIIDEAKPGQMFIESVEDQGALLIRQRRNEIVLANRVAEVFEKVLPQKLGLFCMIEARPVVVKVIPHDAKVGTRGRTTPSSTLVSSTWTRSRSTSAATSNAD